MVDGRIDRRRRAPVTLRAIHVAIAAALLASCLAPPAVTSPTASPNPSPERPRFELATYMYALQAKGRIRIGVVDSEPPFAVREPSGTRTGFEVDLGRDLARAIFGPRGDLESLIEWVPLDRSTAVPALESARVDAVLARIPMTVDAVVDFSDHYFATGERILIRAGDDEIKDLPNLDTKTVCSERGNGVAGRVIEANAFARTLELDTYASCMEALKEGQVDAIAADEARLWQLRRSFGEAKLVGQPITAERYAVAVKKNERGERQAFVAFVNAWLANAVRDGTWARLYAQHVAPLSGETKTSP